MTASQFIHSLAICLMLVVALGCDDGRPARVPVSGRVTIDGQPVTSGSVSFRPPQGRPASGKLDDQGRFTLKTFEPGDGCVPGKHEVTIHSTDLLSRTQLRWNVPKKYQSSSTSDIRVTIDGPKDDLEIQLTWGGQKGPVLETISVE
jgi:hypothetical protein